MRGYDCKIIFNNFFVVVVLVTTNQTLSNNISAKTLQLPIFYHKTSITENLKPNKS